MTRTIYGKKFHDMGDSFLATFKNLQTLQKYYTMLENDRATTVNFRGEINNSACFCKNDEWSFKPEINHGKNQFYIHATLVKAKSEAARLLGALGGSVKSKAKSEAARKNGAKGGRPSSKKDM